MTVQVEPTHQPLEDHLLLEATDTPRHYWRISATENEENLWEILLASNQNVITPEVHVTSNGHVLLGMEQAIFCLDGQTGRQLQQVKDGDVYYFRSFQELSGGNILADDELQLHAFTPDGRRLWRAVFHHLIDDVQEVEGCLQVTDQEGNIFSVDRTTGVVNGERVVGASGQGAELA